MFATLEPLHAMLERGPQTLKETSFHQVSYIFKFISIFYLLVIFQAYGRELLEAQDWCRRYKTSLNVRDLNQAWDLYYHVFRRISRQLPQLTSLELQYVSPKLLLCRYYNHLDVSRIRFNIDLLITETWNWLFREVTFPINLSLGFLK